MISFCFIFHIDFSYTNKKKKKKKKTKQSCHHIVCIQTNKRWRETKIEITTSITKEIEWK
jgi:hypothetical protein